MTNLPDTENKKDTNVNQRLGDDGISSNLSFPTNEFDAVIGFFENRGFGQIASRAVASTLLRQAKIDSVNVFKLIETLKGTSDLELNSVVTEVLNRNREKTSLLGFKNQGNSNKLEKRNIIP